MIDVLAHVMRIPPAAQAFLFLPGFLVIYCKSFRCEFVCLSLITPLLPGFCVAQSRPWLFLPGKLGSLREDCREQRKDEAATTCCAVKIEAGIWGSDWGCGLCHETTPWLLVIDTHV